MPHREARLLRPFPRCRVSRRRPEVPLPRAFAARVSLLLLLLALAAPASAAKPAAGEAPAAKPALTILYGDDHVFGIVPPAGWTVDDTSGLGSRIRVVLYPKGQKWDSAPTVMYVNSLHQDAKARRTLAQMIERDVKSFQDKAPNGRVLARKPLKTAKAQAAEVRYFAPTGGEPVEAVAYVAEEDVVVLLVLSAREPGGFRRHLPAFESLVASYQFVAGGIETPR